VEEEAKKELEATLAARRELGPEHDEHLIAGFLERIEGEIDRRVAERLPKARPPDRRELGIAIPIVAVAGIFGGAVGVFAALAAVVIVFLVLTLSRR
jgi:hypothetical protein